MTAIKQRLQEDPQRLLDQLADNELSPDDRRELLAALDDEPDGWRRCALAFVEAQVWREELCGLPEAEVGLSAMLACTSADGLQTGRARERWPFIVALAASLLVAFAIGRYGAVPGLNRNVAMSTRASTETHPPKSRMAETEAPGNAGRIDDTAPRHASPAWETVKVSIEDASADGLKTVEVPCMDVAQIDPEWLEQLDSAIPSRLLKTLHDTGHTVKTDRQWWPVELTDGRHVVLPVEQVEVEYVGGEFY